MRGSAREVETDDGLTRIVDLIGTESMRRQSPVT